MNIRLLGAHNCESQTTRFVSLLVDDCLVLDAGGLTSSLSFSEQQKLKVILLSHHHYDHIRDVPAVAMNFLLAGASIDIYSTSPVYERLTKYLMDGTLYPNFLERPEENPAVRFTVIEPHESVQIEGYTVLAVPVSHSVPAVGYQVTSSEGKAVFYAGDTGAGLADCWQRVSPQLLIIELTAANRFEEFAREAGHLTPGLLRQELVAFRELKGYLPQVVTVHMNPALEEEIEAEIALVAEELDTPITLGCEGMELHL